MGKTDGKTFAILRRGYVSQVWCYGGYLFHQMVVTDVLDGRAKRAVGIYRKDHSR